MTVNPEALSHLFQEELYRFSSPIIVVVSKGWDQYTGEEQLLLKKILTSVKVDINAVHIIVQSNLELKSLASYTPERVLIFGSQTSEDIPMYKDTPAQGFTVIRADDLGVLDDQKKKSLWLALRQMFGV